MKVKKSHKNKNPINQKSEDTGTISTGIKQKRTPKKSKSTRELSKPLKNKYYLEKYNNRLWLDRISAEKACEKRGIEIGEKRGFEKGEKSGFEKGEKSGFEKGEKRGIKIGEKRGERKVKINEIKVAFSMALNNIDQNDIAQYLNLSMEELSEIFKFLKDSKYKITELAERLNITKDELIEICTLCKLDIESRRVKRRKM